MEANPPTLDRRAALIALAVGAAILTGLYGLFPYNFGYGLVPVPVFDNLWQMWFSDKLADWGHCFLVPLIVVFLIWWERRKLAATPIEHNTAAGLAAIIGAGLFYWLGYKIDFAVFGFLSVQVTIAALIIWFFGWRFMLAVFIPWAFLIFAWPMPFIQTSGLRMFMTTMSVQLLNLLDLGAIQQGTAIISAPDYTLGLRAGERFLLDVAAACSGIRSLFSLMMMSALAGYLMLGKNWQRLVIFLCSIPLAIIGNIFRIIMLALGCQLWGQSFAIGTEEHPSVYHSAAGFMVFLVALGGLFTISWLINGGWQTVLVVFGFRRPAAPSVTNRGPA
jgi:exosortase